MNPGSIQVLQIHQLVLKGAMKQVALTAFKASHDKILQGH